MGVKCFIGASAGALALSGAAAAEFTGVSIVDVLNPDPDERTIRLFAGFDHPFDTLLAVGGWEDIAPVVFDNSHSLINHDGPFAGTQAADFPGAPISGEFDSWVSINQLAIDVGDTDYTVDFTGVPTDQQAIVGTHWEQKHGGWFDSDPGTTEQADWMIIAQFTFHPSSTGSLSGLVFWAPGADGDFVGSEFAALWPAPGTLALLAVAGLAGARGRRRQPGSSASQQQEISL